VVWRIIAKVVLAFHGALLGQVPTYSSDKTQIEQFSSFMRDGNWPKALESFSKLQNGSLPDFDNLHARLCILNGQYEAAEKLVESKEKPITDHWCHTAFAIWYQGKSSTKCRFYLSRSLELEPTVDAASYAVEFALTERDIQFGAESLLKLYRRHPIYMAGYSTTNGFRPTEDDIQFANNQLAILCKDRPSIAKLIEEYPRLRDWLVDRFTGVHIGRRVKWSASRPEDLHSKARAGHQTATTYSDGSVWVSAELEASEQISLLIFELLNAENSTEACQLHERAIWGKIDKKSYVKEIGRLEHRALLKRKAFFVTEYVELRLPKTDPIDYWGLDVPFEFEAYFALQPQYTTNYYEEHFERIRPK
jgi:hypothetical protein